VFGWWRGLRRFGEDTGGSAGREDVAGIVLLNVPSTDAAIFLGELDLEWQPRPNRALYQDRHAARTEVIVPFVRPSATGAVRRSASGRNGAAHNEVAATIPDPDGAGVGR
jgi:S-DNA-T family DNA segregation ATPase FtsK/SpoIIIE